jgi:ATP-dependent RNA helicase DeaD
MGRDGTAYTFVTPEEGSELTRIEMRIDRLLRRFEVVGFESGEKPVGVPTAADGAAPGQPAADEAPKEPAPAPMFGRGGRPLKRYRRAL